MFLKNISFVLQLVSQAIDHSGRDLNPNFCLDQAVAGTQQEHQDQMDSQYY